MIILKKIYFSLCHLEIRLNFQLHPTEPAKYRGSYTAASKEIVDIEIAIYRNAGIVISYTITVAPETIVIATMGLLLKLTVSEEQEEGGLRN
jgi:hypothetical protein